MTFNGVQVNQQARFQAVTDSRNRIHVFGRYLDAHVPEGFDDRQATYAVFDFEGRVIADPILIGPEVGYRDSITRDFSIEVGEDDVLYLLWGNQQTRTRYITIADSSGDVVLPSRIMEGLGQDHNSSGNYYPRLHIDSRGNLIVVSQMSFPPDTVRRRPFLAYARYDPEGALLDSFRIIDEEQYIAS